MYEVNLSNDINIDIVLLPETISRLKSDNEKITETINNIYNSINILNDEEVWKSPEKEKMMEELIPYLEETKTSLHNDLDNCLNTLTAALDAYTEDNDLLKKHADEITKIVEE